MKLELIKVCLKLYLNDGAKTSYQVLSDTEYLVHLPKLVDEGIVVPFKNKRYHYVAITSTTYSVIKDLVDVIYKMLKLIK